MSKIVNIVASGKASSIGTAHMTATFHITNHFLRGALIQTQLAKQVEISVGEIPIGEQKRFEHMSFCIAAIVQAAGAIESEYTYVLFNGIGGHLGTGEKKHKLATPDTWKKGLKRKLSIPAKCNELLKSLGLSEIEKTSDVFRNSELICQIRNKLVHYEGKSNEEYEEKSYVVELSELSLDPPSWVKPAEFPFPHRCLSASLGFWAVESALNFICEVYMKGGVQLPSNFELLKAEIEGFA